MRPRTPILATLLAALLLSAAAEAQHRRGPDRDRGIEELDTRRPTLGFMGGRLELARPRGEFARSIDQGIGGNLHYIHKLDRDGWLGLRLDGGVVVYGMERERVLLSSTIGGRILADLVTTNNIATVGLGPQIGLPVGGLRPYVNGFAGLSYLYTTSSIEGSAGDEPFASTTNFDDATFAYGAGAGIYVPLSRRSTPVSLDLGATYRNSGRAEYLREGDIRDNPDGSITVFPSYTDTDMVTFHVGVTVGVPRRGR